MPASGRKGVGIGERKILLKGCTCRKPVSEYFLGERYISLGCDGRDVWQSCDKTAPGFLSVTSGEGNETVAVCNREPTGFRIFHESLIGLQIGGHQ